MGRGKQHSRENIIYHVTVLIVAIIGIIFEVSLLLGEVIPKKDAVPIYGNVWIFGILFIIGIMILLMIESIRRIVRK